MMKNLKNWHEFEMKYPNIFQGMYQFWVKKNKMRSKKN